MEGDFIKINEWLLPLSWFYGIGVGFRNFLFEVGILKSRAFKTPIISVGNITVGGTGKTPHVEYLVRLLHEKMRVAVLSRGYKRKSHGFMVAEKDTPMRLIGDEPYQIKKKFPHITVAVDKKRAHGIDLLENSAQAPDVILLDDAFQHRYVKPGINILLVDYHRLVIYDKLLPAGRMREPLKGKDRADIVIITKCPKELKPMNFRVITKAMNLYPYQHLFFTTLDYDQLHPLFETAPKGPGDLSQQNVLLLTGIASPQQLTEDIKPKVKSITPLAFADHHDFSHKDVELLNKTFADMSAPKCMITTEKDAARLTQIEGFSEEVKKNSYVQPLRISFMLNQEEDFNNLTLGYVMKNSRNHIVAQQKDGHNHKSKKQETTKPKTISFR